MAPGLNKEETKAAVKEAVKEWLNEIFEKFGKWGAKAIGAAFLGALLWAVVQMNGWRN